MYIQVLVLVTFLVVLVFNVLYLNHAKTNSLYLDRARKTNQDWVIVNIKNKHRVSHFYSNKNDGVKLHVDHIFPIAKGGRTDPSNLRTLCDQCNLGKKDKIELV